MFNTSNSLIDFQFSKVISDKSVASCEIFDKYLINNNGSNNFWWRKDLF